jgi:hypothetical protein
VLYIEDVSSIMQLRIKPCVVCPQNKPTRNEYNAFSPATVLKNNEEGNEDVKK